MTACREELLVYGYIKEWHKRNNIELPPNDIISAFVSWIKLLDLFDKKFCHKDIKFHPESETKFQCKGPTSYPSAIGSMSIKRGMKQSWTFKIKQNFALLGIIDEEIVQNSGNAITDFTNSTFKGYGITTNLWSCYHILGAGRVSINFRRYSNQFVKEKSSIVTMELDMTQKESEHAILKYVNHGEPKENVKEIRTDKEFSNIAWNDIDINREYRMAIAPFAYRDDIEWNEIIE